MRVKYARVSKRPSVEVKRERRDVMQIIVAQVIQVLFLLVSPYFIIRLTKTVKALGFLSPILLSYIIGIILGNIKFIPFDQQLAMSLSEIMVPLAIPLILFATDFTAWLRLAKKTVISFLLVISGVLISASLGAVIFSGHFAEYWKLSGMLVGVYTGGTPNLMAVGMGLDVSKETLSLAIASDAIMGGIYFFFLLSGAKWLFGKVLPVIHKSSVSVDPSEMYASVAATDDARAYDSCACKRVNLRLGLAVLLSVIFTGVSVGLSWIIWGRIDVCLVMLLVTTLGVGASFVRKIRTLKGTYEAGQYLILVFSLAMGININLSELFGSSSIVFLYTAFVMTLAIIIHLILAVIFQIDVDTMIITSTAGIFGPAFIGPVASGIKNKEVILSGLTSGLVGYAVGNYLGFFLAWLLRLFV